MLTVHKSVLLHEVLSALSPKDGDVILDATLGGGGHAEALLGAARVSLVGLDADEEAIARVEKRLQDAGYADRASLNVSNFRAVGSVLERQGIEAIDKALFDLGLSSDELEVSGRGFSLLRDEPLSMVFDKAQSLTAADLLQHLNVQELTNILKSYGEERYAFRIAKAIVEARQETPILRTLQLADLVKRSVPSLYARGRIHPATKTFQALRMAVNDELDALREGLRAAWKALKPGGVLAVISFHSIEDRIVKQFMKGEVLEDRAEVLYKKPITPSEVEVSTNPRARSAKLRAARKL